MKSSKYIIVLLVLGGLVMSSCQKSFLVRSPQGALGGDEISNKKGINVLLVGAYAALAGQDYDENAGNIQSLGGGNAWGVSPSNWLLGSVRGGDAHKGSDGTDQPSFIPIFNFSITPTNDVINDKWNAVYEGITRCNNVLRYLPGAADLSGEEATNIKAQARFLRAHYYFDLKRDFNMVPWIDETTTDLLQSNTADIWPKIEADFQFAYDSLPETQDEVGRANKWAAGAYLAKTYLYEKKYAEAEPVFTAVINQGATPNGIKYALNEAFEHNYMPQYEDQNPEAVFVVEMAANVGSGSINNSNQGDMLNFPYGGNSPFDCCGFFQPSIDLVNSFRTDADGLPYLDDYNSHAVKNDMGLLSTQPFTPDPCNLDPRLDWTVGRRGIPYLDYGIMPGQDWVRLQSYAGPYSPIKNAYWNATQDQYGDNSQWAPGSAINVFVIRFADVLLMAAEVEAQMNNFPKAEEYVNEVRHRMIDHPEAWVKTYNDDSDPSSGFSTTDAANYKIAAYPAGAFSSQAYALKAIYFERKLELAMEGYRFFDLVRWGMASDVINAYFSYEGAIVTDVRGAHFTANKNEYEPIPQAQLDITQKDGKATLTQNQGYK